MKFVLISIAVLVLIISVGKDIRQRSQIKAAHSRRLAQLRRNLLIKSLNDEGTVDSLIEYERKKHGSLPLDTLMEYAIESWEHDNR